MLDFVGFLIGLLVKVVFCEFWESLYWYKDCPSLLHDGKPRKRGKVLSDATSGVNKLMYKAKCVCQGGVVGASAKDLTPLQAEGKERSRSRR